MLHVRNAYFCEVSEERASYKTKNNLYISKPLKVLELYP